MITLIIEAHFDDKTLFSQVAITLSRQKKKARDL